MSEGCHQIRFSAGSGVGPSSLLALRCISSFSLHVCALSLGVSRRRVKSPESCVMMSVSLVPLNPQKISSAAALLSRRPCPKKCEIFSTFHTMPPPIFSSLLFSCFSELVFCSARTLLPNLDTSGSTQSLRLGVPFLGSGGHFSLWSALIRLSTDAQRDGGSLAILIICSLCTSVLWACLARSAPSPDHSTGCVASFSPGLPLFPPL